MSFLEQLAEIRLMEDLLGFARREEAVKDFPQYIRILGNWGMTYNENIALAFTGDLRTQIQNPNIPDAVFGTEDMYPPPIRKSTFAKGTSVKVHWPISGTSRNICYAFEILAYNTKQLNAVDKMLGRIGIAGMNYQGTGSFTMAYNPQGNITGRFADVKYLPLMESEAEQGRWPCITEKNGKKYPIVLDADMQSISNISSKDVTVKPEGGSSQELGYNADLRIYARPVGLGTSTSRILVYHQLYHLTLSNPRNFTDEVCGLIGSQYYNSDNLTYQRAYLTKEDADILGIVDDVQVFDSDWENENIAKGYQYSSGWEGSMRPKLLDEYAFPHTDLTRFFLIYNEDGSLRKV